MRILQFALIGLLMITFSCQKSVETNQGDVAPTKRPPAVVNSCGYLIEGGYDNGNRFNDYNAATNQTTFKWKITNPNPGNGTNGTYQALSHWNLLLGNAACGENGLNLENLDEDIEEVYVVRNGITTQLTVPVLQPDGSLAGCFNPNPSVFKFDIGFTGSSAEYVIVLKGKWNTATTDAYFKSGANTGCCTKPTTGIGCRLDDDFCSFSQGYWFARPHTIWPATGSLIGGLNYTQEQGKAIWSASNAGGKKDAKKAFLQASAVKLSYELNGLTIPASVQADLDIIDAYFVSLHTTLGGKMTASNIPANSPASALAAAAASRLSTYIQGNHCQ